MCIPSDKIVMVTGEPRSGTSLVMQTLVALGVPVAGDKFLNANNPEALSLNPRGFYEVPGVVMRGIQEVGPYGGQAIKIVSSAAYPRQNLGTPPEIVERYILCLRDPRPVALSQTNLKRPVRVAGEDGWSRAPVSVNPTRYVLENGGLARFLSEQSCLSRWLVVDYDAFLLSPAQMVDRIIAHLSIPATNREAAIANVDPNLCRSDCTDWTPEMAVAGELASSLYEALRQFDVKLLREVSERIAEFASKLQREHARWYDESVGLLVTPSLERALRTDPGLRQQYVSMADREKLHGLHPCSSPDYAEPDDAPEYIIERPADLGPLSRSLVRYAGELVTREQAFLLHQHSRGQPV